MRPAWRPSALVDPLDVGTILTGTGAVKQFAAGRAERPRTISRVALHKKSVATTKGGVPYIPFREGEKKKPNPSGKGELWKRMYHFYKYQEGEFKQHYHKRSNVETVFSMIKAKFGERLRSKTETAQVNEVLTKVLCHNISVVIQSMYELGIEADFRAEEHHS